MATMVKFLRETESFVDETYQRRNEAEENRDTEYKNVVRIQSWFRGTRTRKYIGHLNHSAREIQRRWRGFLGRRHIREILKSQVFVMKLNHYNLMATKVQKVWRGFYIRKYVSNYYSRKRYLEGLVLKNEIVREELEGYAEQQEMMGQIKKEKLDKEKLDDYAKRHHFLLSTQVMPGVYNSPFKPYPNEMEYHLRCAKATLAKEQKRKEKSADNIFDPGYARYDLPRLKDPLPPLQKRPQGPFRDLSDVQKQRYKTFQPSLRVATNFYSLEEARQEMKDEEWVTRLNDDIFVPFSKKNVPYEKLLHATSKYGHLPYGNKFFRHEYPVKWLAGEKFQSVVPPVPIFDKLNDTYSQGQV